MMRVRPTARNWAALAIGVALLVGCAGRLQKPEVSLAGVELVGLGLSEQRLLLKLRIGNPNDVDLPVNALSFDLELNGRSFAKGVSERPVIVLRQGEALLEVKTLSRLAEVLRELREARKTGSGTLRYRLFGRVELDGSGSVPFDRSGELPLSALEKFVPK